ncbi:hypothetical protein [Bacillus phage vB_BanS-Thrax3]|nr:hypothetical protein [Bacillus phage vB_BanS-Thrax3]
MKTNEIYVLMKGDVMIGRPYTSRRSVELMYPVELTKEEYHVGVFKFSHKEKPKDFK